MATQCDISQSKSSFSDVFRNKSREVEKNEAVDLRDGTLEGDRILGEAAIKIRKECELISEEEFYREVGMWKIKDV